MSNYHISWKGILVPLTSIAVVVANSSLLLVTNPRLIILIHIGLIVINSITPFINKQQGALQ